MDSLQVANGHRHWHPTGPNEILYHHAQTLGRIEAKVDDMGRRIQKLEDSSMFGLRPMHWIQIGIGITVLGAAVTGRMSWGESLPIVGRMFSGM